MSARPCGTHVVPVPEHQIRRPKLALTPQNPLPMKGCYIQGHHQQHRQCCCCHTATNQCTAAIMTLSFTLAQPALVDGATGTTTSVTDSRLSGESSEEPFSKSLDVLLVLLLPVRMWSVAHLATAAHRDPQPATLPPFSSWVCVSVCLSCWMH